MLASWCSGKWHHVTHDHSLQALLDVFQIVYQQDQQKGICAQVTISIKQVQRRRYLQFCILLSFHRLVLFFFGGGGHCSPTATLSDGLACPGGSWNEVWVDPWLQQLIITRQAFDAELELDNSASNSMTDIFVVLTFTALDGTDAASQFAVGQPSVRLCRSFLCRYSHVRRAIKNS
jgi:hypothetical protein